MLTPRLRLLLLFAIIGLQLCIVSRCSAQTDRLTAVSAVLQADQNIEAAFVSLRTAEEAGADVSKIASTLNEALRDLALGKTALESGMYSDAISAARRAANGAKIVESSATELAASAPGRVATERRNQLVLSSVSGIVIVFWSLAIWRQFKRNRSGGILRLRPEIPAQSLGTEFSSNTLRIQGEGDSSHGFVGGSGK